MKWETSRELLARNVRRGERRGITRFLQDIFDAAAYRRWDFAKFKSTAFSDTRSTRATSESFYIGEIEASASGVVLSAYPRGRAKPLEMWSLKSA